jgi:zinc D-Ala-D-Ala carboxypeptidase
MLLCMALETIREHLGDKPIRIVSGYRTAAYNRAIGGARRSQHVEGRAVDFTVQGVTPARVHSAVLALYQAGAIGIGGLGRYPTFTHIDVRSGSRLARWEGGRKAT